MAENIANISVGVTVDKASLSRAQKDITSALASIEKLAASGGTLSRSFSQPLGRISGQVSEFEKSLEAANARVVAFGASAGAVFQLANALQGLVKSTINVEKQLYDLNAVLNINEKDLKRFGDSLFDIAKQTGQSFGEVSKAAVEFSRQGLSVEQTLKRTRDALILSRLTGLDVVSSTEALTAAVNTFNDAAIDTTVIVNKLANVDAKFAVSSADLAEAIKRVGGSAVDAGLNLDQLIATVTVAQQKTARGGAVIGNSLKTIFTRLQNSTTLDQLESLGVAIKDTEGRVLPAITVLQNFSRQYDKLGQSQRAAAAELVGGIFQINILKSIVSDLGTSYSQYDRALKTSSESTDEAIKRNEGLNQSLDALLKGTLSSLTKFGASVGEISVAPAIKNVLEGVNAAIEAFTIKDKDSLGGKLAEGLLGGIGKVLSGPGLALIGVILGKIIINFSKFGIDASKTFLGLNTGAKHQAELQQLIQNILLKNPSLINAAASSAQNQAAIERELLFLVTSRNAALEQSLVLSRKLAANIGPAVLKDLNRSTSGGATRSGGFIPNYARHESQEVMGAIAGGYMPGKVTASPVGGVMNSAETVKYVPGFAQPFINPPEGSDAGRDHKSNSLRQTGINPYASRGFIPNFVKAQGSIFEKSNSVISLKNNGEFEIPKNKEFNGVADQRIDSVKGLKYNIITKGDYSHFEKRFNEALRKEDYSYFQEHAGLDKGLANIFFSNTKSKNPDVKPLTPGATKKVNREKQKQSVKNGAMGDDYESYLAEELKLKRTTDGSRLDFESVTGSSGGEAKLGKYDYSNLLAKAIATKGASEKLKSPFYQNDSTNRIDLTDLPLNLYTTKKPSSGGFIPNFAPVTGGQFDDFDETIVHYPLGTDPKELFGPESVKKASLTTYGKSLVGSKTPINVVTARESNSRQAIQDFLVKSNIPVNKVVTTGSMFRKTNLDSSGKKAEYIKKTFSKYGQPINLTDDSERNIAALQSLNNPSITGTLYKEAGQQGLGQELSKAPIPVLNKVFQLRQTANEKQAIKNVQNNPGRGSAGEVRDWEISHELGRLYEEQLKMGGLAQAGFTNINHLSGKGAAAPFGSNFPADFYARSGATPWFLDAKSTSANESKQSRLGPKATTMQNAWDSIKGNKSHVEALEKGLWEKISKGQESINFGVVASEVPGPTARGYKRPDSIVKGFKNLNRDRDGALETYGNFSGGFVPNFANELTIANGSTKTNEKLGERRFRFLSEFLKNRVKRPLPTLSENDHTDAINYLGDTNLKPSDLNRDLSAGYFGGAFPFGRTQTGSIAKLLKKNGFQFTFNEGFVPNFAPVDVFHGTDDPLFDQKLKETGLKGLKKKVNTSSGSGTSFNDDADMRDINGRGLFLTQDLSTAKKYGKYVFKTRVDDSEFYDYNKLSKRGLGTNAFYSDTRPDYIKKIKGMRGGSFTDTEKAEGSGRTIPGFPNKEVTKNMVVSRGLKNLNFARVMAGGFVPNFANPLSEAMGREEAAGYSSSQVKVGFDSRLKSSGGVGVYNTTEGSLSNAINMHKASGKSAKDLQSQGAAKGFVPNFADEGAAAGIIGLDLFALTFAFQGLKEAANASSASILKEISVKEDGLKKEKAGITKRQGDLAVETRNNNKALASSTTTMNNAIGGGSDAQKLAHAQLLADQSAIKAKRELLIASQRQNTADLAALSVARKEEQATSFKTKAGRFFDKGGAQALMAAPIITEQIANLIPKTSVGSIAAGSAASGIGEIASAASTGALIGTAVPVIGPAVGAAIGGLVGLVGAINEVSKASGKYEQILRNESIISLDNNIKKSEDLISSLNKLGGAFENVFSSQRGSKEYARNLKELNAVVFEMASKGLKVDIKPQDLLNLDLFKEKIRGIGDELARQRTQDLGVSGLKKAISENKGLKDLTGEKRAEKFGGGRGIGRVIADEAIAWQAGLVAILNSFNPFEAYQDVMTVSRGDAVANGERMAKDFAPDIKKVFDVFLPEDLGEKQDEFIAKIRSAAKTGDLSGFDSKLQNSIGEIGLTSEQIRMQMSHLGHNYAQGAAEAKKTAGLVGEAVVKNENFFESISSFNRSILNSINKIKIKEEIRAASAKAANDIDSELSKGFERLIEPFTSKKSFEEFQFGAKRTDLAAGRALKENEAAGKLRESLLSSVSEFREKVLPKSQSDSNKFNQEDTKKLQDLIQEANGSIIQDDYGKLAKAIEGLGDLVKKPDAPAAGVSGVADKFGGQRESVKNFVQAFKDTYDAATTEEKKRRIEFETQSRILDIQEEISKRILDNQKKINFGGGLEASLDPSKRLQDIGKIQGDIAFGRAAGDKGLESKGLLDLSKVMASFGQAGAFQGTLEQNAIGGIGEMLSRFAPELRDALGADGIEEIAKKQVEAALQPDKAAEELNKALAELKTELSLLAGKTAEAISASALVVGQDKLRDAIDNLEKTISLQKPISQPPAGTSPNLTAPVMADMQESNRKEQEQYAHEQDMADMQESNRKEQQQYALEQEFLNTRSWPPPPSSGTTISESPYLRFSNGRIEDPGAKRFSGTSTDIQGPGSLVSVDEIKKAISLTVRQPSQTGADPTPEKLAGNPSRRTFLQAAAASVESPSSNAAVVPSIYSEDKVGRTEMSYQLEASAAADLAKAKMVKDAKDERAAKVAAALKAVEKRKALENAQIKNNDFSGALSTRLFGGGDIPGSLDKGTKDKAFKLNTLNQVAAEIERLSDAGLDARKVFEALTPVFKDATEERLSGAITEAQYLNKLAAASSKFNLELSKLNFEKGAIFVEDLRSQIQKTNEDAIKNKEYGMDNVKSTIGGELSYSQADRLKATDETIRRTTASFRDGTTDALFEAIKGTKTLKQAFGDMFMSIADDLLKSGIKQGVNSLFSGIASYARSFSQGGVVKGYSSGGTVTGGSGVRDDVPAYLNKGEFVIRKASAQKLGIDYLNSLNSGSAIKRGDGGEAMFRGKNEYLYDDEKKPTRGTLNVDERLSILALTDEDNPQNKIREERRDSLIQYLADKAEHDEQQKKMQEDFKKAKRQRAKGALIGAAIQIGGTYLGNKIGEAGAARKARASSAPYRGRVDTGANMPNNKPLRMPLPTVQTKMPKLSAGGLSGTDDVPAMLTGGEYVIRKDAVDKYGLGFFNKLNAGNARGYAEGGLVGGVAPIGEASSAGVNNINITVNVSNNGSADTSVKTEGRLMDDKSGKALADAINNSVIKTIIAQKKPGGLLY